MREEFFLDYQGFNGVPSKCHLRILVDTGKPVFVVCSELPNNPGTSVQNAYENIRALVYQYLQKKLVEKQNNEVAKTVDEFAEIIEKTKKLHIAVVIFLLKRFSEELRNKEGILDVLGKEIPEVVWIEHWPKGTGINPENVGYLQVSENQAGSPDWQGVSIQALAKKYGINERDILMSEDAFK